MCLNTVDCHPTKMQLELELCQALHIPPSARTTTTTTMTTQDAQDHSTNTFIAHVDASLTNVPHCYQLESWDCGMACLLMVHRWLSMATTTETEKEGLVSSSSSLTLTLPQSSLPLSPAEIRLRDKILSNMKSGESIWTSDIVWQLHLQKQQQQQQQQQPWLLWWPLQQQQIQQQQKQHFPRVTTTCRGRPRQRPLFHVALCSQNLNDANEIYRDYHYYQNNFDNDQHRVKATFQALQEKTDGDDDASTVAMLLTTPSNKLSLCALVRVLKRRDCVAIALIDNNILTGRKEPKTMNRSSTRRKNDTTTTTETTHGGVTNYSGHYIVICGVSTQPQDVESALALDDGVPLIMDDNDQRFDKGMGCKKDNPEHEKFCFAICNPAPSSDPLVFISPQRFELSWRANGTDEDIVFIRKESSCV